MSWYGDPNIYTVRFESSDETLIDRCAKAVKGKFPKIRIRGKTVFRTLIERGNLKTNLCELQDDGGKVYTLLTKKMIAREFKEYLIVDNKTALEIGKVVMQLKKERFDTYHESRHTITYNFILAPKGVSQNE